MEYNKIGPGLYMWLDTETGEFYKVVREPYLEPDKLVSALREGVDYVFDLYNTRRLFNNAWPCGESSGVDIKFSDERKCDDKKVPEETLVLGEFSPTRSRKPGTIGTITLYNKTIAEFCNNYRLDYTTVFWATLVREAFRALYYSMFLFRGSQKWWDGDDDRKDRDIVKESLAATTEYVFLLNLESDCLSIDYSRRMREYLENTWRSYDIEDNPSSGALGISGCGLTEVETPSDMISVLINKSFGDWKAAADIIRVCYQSSASHSGIS